MRTPAFRQLAKLLLGRPLGQAKQLADLDLHGKIAGGEGVGPAFREKEVDFCGPAANALHPGQQFDRLLVIDRQFVEIELA